MLGAERLIYCRLGSNQLILRSYDEQLKAPIGSTLRVKPREGHIHHFGAVTGKRID